MRLKKGQTGNLHIVKNAGLKLNKKDKSVNSKAGLDGKGKTEKGVTKVKRRKPLELKHVRRLRKVGLVFACVGVAGVTAVGLGFFPKAPVEELSGVEYNTVCFEKPVSGSPCDYSVVENVGYLNYVLQNQPYWSSDMRSTVHTVMEQTVNTYKKYYGGVLVSADIEQGVSSKATQFCVADGVVLWRSSANKNYNGMDTEWSQQGPSGLTVSNFKKQRGLPPSEFSVYVLNENTIKNANDYSVTDNGDGTFTMSLELNVNTGDDATSADYYYKQQMYVTGGLDKKPEILSTTLKYTFDSDWRVLEFEINDDYYANMVIAAHCTSETYTKYYYEEEKAKNTYYEDYFKSYVNNFAEAEEPDNSTPSALNYLAAAFGSVLDEGATFKLNVGMGELKLDGVVHVGLNNGSLEDIRLKLGDISVFMAENSLYISDGAAKYKLDTSAFAAAQTAEEEGEASGGFDMNSLMDQLTGGEFTVTDSGAKLDTKLELFGLKITLHFTFEVKDGAVSLGDVKAEIPVGNTQVNATLAFGTEGDIPAKPEDISGYTDILKEGIALKTDISVDGLTLSGIIKVVMDEGKFAGVHINLDSLAVYYDCPRNMLYLSDGNVKYKLSLDSANSVDISSILGNLDVNSLLSEIIKNISSSKDGVSTSATLNILEQTINAVVAVKLAGGIGVGADLEVLGHKVTANVGLTNEQVSEPDYDEYTDILNEGLTLDVDLTVDELNLSGLVYIGLKDSKLTEVRADLGDIEVYYKNNTLYITDGVVKYQVAIPASEDGISFGNFDINGLLKEVIDNLAFNKDGVSTGATLNILEQTINAAVFVKLNGGIGVGANLEVLGHKVNATVGLTNEVVAEPNYDEYIDILNDGLNIKVDLTVDETLNLNGLVYIGLKDSKLTEVRADLGEIEVYYINNVLYITDGTVKYQVTIPASGSQLSFGNFDLNGLLKEVIDNLSFSKDGISTGATLNILEQTINAAVSVKLNGGIGIGANLEVLGHKVNATVGLTNEQVAEPNYNEYVDILNNGLTLDVDLTVDEALNLNGLVFIGLNDSKLTEVRADLGDIEVYYINNVLYITDGTVKYQVTIPASESSASFGNFDLNGLLKEVIDNLTFNKDGVSTGATLNILEQTINAAVSVKLNGGIGIGANLEVLGHKVAANVGLTNEEVAEPNYNEYIDILNNGLTLDVDLTVDEALNLNGLVYIGLKDSKLTEVRADLGDIEVYYKNNTLYITDGNVKYKVAIPASGSSASFGNFDLNGLLKEVIDNLAFNKDGVSTGATLNILEQTINAAVSVKLNGGIGVGANLEVLGHKVNATVGLANEEVAVPNYDEYVDILNEGLTLNVDLKIDETLNLNGLVYIGLKDSKLTEVRADLGEIEVYYKNNTLYITDGNVKYKVAIPASGSSASFGNFDLNGLLKEVIDNLAFNKDGVSTGATLNILEQTINAAVSVKLNGGIGVGANLEVLGHKVNATVGLTNEEVAKPNYDEYIDILNDGLNLKVDLTVDETLNLNGLVYIGLKDSKLTEVRADLGEIEVYYINNVLYITDGTVKYQVTIPASEGGVSFGNFDLNGLLKEVIDNLAFNKDGVSTSATLNILEQTINAAVSVKLNGGIGVGANLEVLGHKVNATVGLTNEVVAEPNYNEYVDILNNGLTLDVDLTVDEALNLNGLVYIGLNDSKLTEVRADLGDIEVYYINNVLYITDGTVKYQVAIPASGSSASFGNFDLNGLLKEVIDNLAFSKDGISTGATLNILEQTINAAVSVKLNGGIGIGANLEVLGHKVNATVGLTNEEVAVPNYDEYIDILNDGLTLDVSLTLDEKNAYGDGAINLKGKVFIGLSDGRFTEIRADFGDIAVYYSTLDKDLYIKVGTTKLKVPLSKIESGEAANVLSALPFDTAEIVKQLLVNLVADAKEISTNANFTILDAIVPVSAKLNFADGIKVEAQLVLLGINLKAGVGLSAKELPALSLGEKDAYTDVIKDTWGAVESLIGDEISAEAEGSIYSYDNAKYAQYGYIKYNFDALFEYSFNSKYYDEEGNELKKSAVNINLGETNDDGVREGMNFWIDSEVYMHFNLELRATSPLDDSLTLDLTVLDANPAATNSGVTGGGYTKDGVLDVYLSVSKYTKDSANYSPLMIYAPMDEIMTLVSMVGAMANLDNISFEENAALDKAVKEIANVVNQLLIENYVPYTKEQFSSLGDSLIPQILGKSLGDFLGEIVEKFGAASGDGEESKFAITEEYINDISCGNDSLKVILNSSAIYGKEMDTDDYLTVQFTKCDGKLDGIYLKNIYFGENNVNELDLGLKLSYGEISRPSAENGLKGYSNFDGIDTLLKALVNSATHRTEGENAYDLNHYYLLNGEVNATINVIGIKINAKIILNSLAVYIDENNKVSVDAHISYDGVQELNQVAINGDTEVYLSIKNDMIYVKRVQKTYWKKTFIVTTEETYDTPVVEYRVMPLSSFVGDMMNQIVFLFNFGSLVSDNLAKAGSETGDGGASFEGRDLGSTFKYILNYYTFSETDSAVNWNFAINGQMLSDLVGMTMSDIPITFTAAKNGDGTLTVKGLTVQQSTMQLWGSAVKLEFGASINYCNPNECTPSITDSSVSVDGLKEINSLSWNDVLGGGSFNDIKKNINWSLLKADTGIDYIRYGNGSPLAVAPLKIKYSSDGSNTNFSYWDREQVVLYNRNTKNIYSYYDTPDLDGLMPKIEGKTAVFVGGYEEENGALVIKAIYDTTYRVSVISANPVNGDFVFDGENYVNTVEEAYERVLLPVHVYYDGADGVRFGLKHYVNSKGDVCNFTEYALNSYGQLCYVAEVVGEESYTAVWERVYAVRFVAEFDGNVTEKVVWYYAGQTLSGNILPSVPAVQGYTGVWDIPENTVIAPDTEYTFNATYTINSYTVTVESKVETTNGDYVLTDGAYKYSNAYNFKDSVTLESLTAKSPAYRFMGFYDNPEFAGAPVTEFTVWDNVTYYAKWESKVLKVTYSSDLSFGNAKLVNGKYEFGAVEMRYDSEDNLANYTEDGRKLLGWFYEEADGSYTYIATAQALKDKFESSDETNVTLHAVWADVKVTIDSFSRGGFLNRQWSMSGSVNVCYVSPLSADIAAKAGLTSTSNVTLYLSFNGSGNEDDKLNDVTINGNGTFGFKNENSGNALSKKTVNGIADVKTTVSCGDAVLAVFDNKSISETVKL